jgi:hypothetical protein
LPQAIAIDWNAPPECPDASEVRAAILAMVGASWARPDALRLAAQANVSKTTAGQFFLRAEVQAGGVTETKSVEAGTCATVADAFALIVALALDPSVGAPSPPAEHAAPAGPAAAATGSQARFEPPIVANHRTEPVLRGLLGPLVAGGLGALPFPAYGVGAKLAIERTFRWELAAMYWPDRPTTVAVDSSGTVAVGARVQLASAQSSFCLVRGAWSWCIAGEVGAMRAWGTGVPSFSKGTSWWVAPSVGAGARWKLAPRLALGIRLDVGVPIFRPSFVVDRVGPSETVQVYRPAPVFAVLRLEPEFEFFSTGSRETRHVH